MKKLMILGASILQLPAIKKAKKMGYQVVAVDMNPEAIGFKEKGISKEVISTIDIPLVVEAAKKHKIDGIMTLASDMPMRTVAVVAEEMNLVGISQETALRATNKAEMRVSLKKANVPVPIFFKVDDKKEYLEAVYKIKEAGYKCIIKPVDNSGSRGISLLSDYNEQTIEKAFNYSSEYSRTGSLMVEEFMEGPEVSVETLSINGECHVIQITDKLTTGEPYFVEMGHSQPSQLPENVKHKICEITIAANRAIGIENGPSHTEIKVTKDGPKIVELGARLGGDNITTHLVPLSTGVDMVECCIKIALGEKVDINAKYQKASAIKYLKTEKGIIQSIEGLEKARNIEGVQQLDMVYGVGDEIGEIRSSVDRVGFVVAQAGDIESAKQCCDRALDEINIRVE